MPTDRKSTYRKEKILPFSMLPSIREKYPKSKIVHCHGVFDVLHAGHLAYFESAKAFGDVLVVTITADEHVHKGPGRPYFTGAIRANMVAALNVVDYVVINPHPLAVPAIHALRPDFYVKGPDYQDKSKDVTGGIHEEEKAVESKGGKLVFTSDDTFASSTLLNSNDVFKIWTDDQFKAIDQIRKAGGLSMVLELLDRISRESVRVVGEPIVDTYVFCRPEGISSKSPSISARFMYEENYAGGSLAIANHLSDFVKDVSILFTHGDEPYFREILNAKMDPRVRLCGHALPSIPTPRKTRFISPETMQRIFEVTDLRSDQWESNDPVKFCQLLRETENPQGVTIVADFGHGLFDGPVLAAAQELPGFVGLNVQSNSSNLGYNPFTKYRNFSFLSIDTKEARMAFHDRQTAPVELARRVRSMYESRGASFAMTLGPHGALYMPARSKEEHLIPAFADNVVDATGAGDAFFAITSMLVKVGCPAPMIPFLGNVFAGLKTKIVGNKASVTRAQLTKAVTSILK